MSQENDKSKVPKISTIHAREKSEPGEDDKPWSILVWIFLLTFVVWGTSYFVLFTGNGRVNGGDMRTEAPTQGAPHKADIAVNGATVYQNFCIPCHQAEGQGLPGAFPPLAGSNWVTGSPEVPIKIVLHGLQGPIDVKGTTYNGVMPAFASQMNDAEIAAVATHIRASWGNAASAIKASEVSELRSKFADRNQSWTAEELAP